jgi:hypothetical protein
MIMLAVYYLYAIATNDTVLNNVSHIFTWIKFWGAIILLKLLNL